MVLGGPPAPWPLARRHACGLQHMDGLEGAPEVSRSSSRSHDLGRDAGAVPGEGDQALRAKKPRPHQFPYTAQDRVRALVARRAGALRPPLPPAPSLAAASSSCAPCLALALLRCCCLSGPVGPPGPPRINPLMWPLPFACILPPRLAVPSPCLLAAASRADSCFPYPRIRAAFGPADSGL